MNIKNSVSCLMVLVSLTACGMKAGVATDTSSQTNTTASTDLVLGMIPMSRVKQIAYNHSGGFPPPTEAPKYWAAVDFKSDGSAVASLNSYASGTQKIDSQALTSADLRSLVSALESAKLGAPAPSNQIDSGNTFLAITLDDNSVQTYQFSGGDSTNAISVIIGVQLQQILEGYLNQSTWDHETTQPLSL